MSLVDSKPVNELSRILEEGRLARLSQNEPPEKGLYSAGSIGHEDKAIFAMDELPEDSAPNPQEVEGFDELTIDTYRKHGLSELVSNT